MIYLLMVMLCLLFIVAFIINEKDIMSPWVISIGMFSLSTFVALMNVNNWDYKISFLCIVVIIGALIVFGMGELTVSRLFEQYPVVKNTVYRERRLELREIPVWVTLLISILLFVGTALIFARVFELSVEAGNTEGYGAMLTYARRIFITPGNHMGRFRNHISLFARAAAYVYMLLIIERAINKRFTIRNVVYFLPVFFHVAIEVLGTGRTFIIHIMAFILMTVFILCNHGKSWNYKNIFRVVVTGLLCLIIYLILFVFLGSLKGGDYGDKVFSVISDYVGSSIPDLSGFLEEPRTESPIIGEETLYGVHNIFRRLGFELPESIRHLKNGVRTNVFTSLRRYISDYGYIGMLLIQLYMGMLYSFIYNILKRRNSSYFLYLIYGWLAFPLVMQSIDDILLSSYISTSSVYLVTYMAILYYLFIGRNNGYRLRGK